MDEVDLLLKLKVNTSRLFGLDCATYLVERGRVDPLGSFITFSGHVKHFIAGPPSFEQLFCPNLSSSHVLHVFGAKNQKPKNNQPSPGLREFLPARVAHVDFLCGALALGRSGAHAHRGWLGKKCGAAIGWLEKTNGNKYDRSHGGTFHVLISYIRFINSQ